MLGLVAFAPTADAASSKVSIAAPRSSQALDQWSKGSITTPKLSAKGKAKITSRSFVITSGGKTVATTSTAGKKIPLAFGSYQVKATVGYKVGKKKKTASKTFTVQVTNSARMSRAEYTSIKTGQTPAQVAAIVGSAGSVVEQGTFPCGGVNCEPFVYQMRKWKTVSAQGYAIIIFADGLVDISLGRIYLG